ncbi:MAG: hypothetical protein GY774_07135 [Planctomycetes bacterium]|nr:hypothetical protein [Planctomycetota bacterium]|tara:strand:+ start:5036 stop:5440 length:405 start_codon:yes stop_codon:yes gene_type:complete
MPAKNNFDIDLELIKCTNINNRTRDFSLETSQKGIRIDNARRISTGNTHKPAADDAADEMYMIYMTLKDDVFDGRLKSNDEGTSKRLLASLDRYQNFTVLSPDTHSDIDYMDMLRRFYTEESKYTVILFDVYKD